MPAGIHANGELVFPVCREDSRRLISARNEERTKDPTRSEQRIRYWHERRLFTLREELRKIEGEYQISCINTGTAKVVKMTN